jgi:ketosteroid isomerase-like protein
MTTSTVDTGDAARALAAHLELIGRDIARWLDLFADDAIVEFPYAASVGAPTRLTGKPAIAAYFGGTPGTFRDLRFRDLRSFPSADPERALAEVHGSARIGAEGRPYEQDYVMVLRTRAGKIVEYREYWDPTPAIAALAGSEFLKKIGQVQR